MNCADIIFINGKVITINETNDIETSIAIKKNKIIFVGDDLHSNVYVGPKTRVINLKGRSLLPGFCDSHIHYVMLGMNAGPVIDVGLGNVNSVREMMDVVKEQVSIKKPGEWICLWGYNQDKLLEKRHPNIQDLNEVAPNNPVRINRDGHIGIYNSKAIQIGGIDKLNQFPKEQIEIVDGKLTGLLRETAHMYMATKINFSDEQILDGLLAADRIMMCNGITTVHDAGSEGIAGIRLMAKYSMQGLIKTRIRAQIFNLLGRKTGQNLINSYIDTGLSSGFGNDRFKIGPMKIMIDGSSSAPSCATRQPYSHNSKISGVMVWSQEEVDKLVYKAHNAGMQVTAHAVGDLAVETMINAIEKAIRDNPRNDPRHRIEHCALTDPELISRIKNLGIIPISNPGFFELNARIYNSYYGDRVDYMFPLKSYVTEGIISAIGSDSPVTTVNPMLSLYGAVARADGIFGDIAGKEQRINILDAIRMFTYNGAYASFEETVKGSLEVGKWADMVVLSDDILKTPISEIKNIKIDFTVIDGEVVYERKA